MGEQNDKGPVIDLHDHWSLIDQVTKLTQRIYALEKAVHGNEWDYQTYLRTRAKERETENI